MEAYQTWYRFGQLCIAITFVLVSMLPAQYVMLYTLDCILVTQFDVTWVLISMLKRVGLVTNVKLPTEVRWYYLS